MEMLFVIFVLLVSVVLCNTLVARVTIIVTLEVINMKNYFEWLRTPATEKLPNSGDSDSVLDIIYKTNKKGIGGEC